MKFGITIGMEHHSRQKDMLISLKKESRGCKRELPWRIWSKVFKDLRLPSRHNRMDNIMLIYHMLDKTLSLKMLKKKFLMFTMIMLMKIYHKWSSTNHLITIDLINTEKSNHKSLLDIQISITRPNQIEMVNFRLSMLWSSTRK
jgi:hypothetical protein